MYGWDIPEVGIYTVTVPECEVAKVMHDVSWTYHGESGWSYGRDSEGQNYEMSPDGKVKRIYSLNERCAVVAMAGRLGPGIAARKYGVPRETIKSWARRPIAA